MSNQNDASILQLKDLIEKKKEALGKPARFSPVTNCSLEFEGTRYNLHALPKPKVIELLVKLNSLLLSAIDLELQDQYMISGYKLPAWVHDLNARLAILARQDEEQELKMYEQKLHKLLSEGKKVELEIKDIAKQLGIEQ